MGLIILKLGDCLCQETREELSSSRVGGRGGSKWYQEPGTRQLETVACVWAL